jgi:hypothetical protein
MTIVNFGFSGFVCAFSAPTKTINPNSVNTTVFMNFFIVLPPAALHPLQPMAQQKPMPNKSAGESSTRKRLARYFNAFTAS